MTAPTMHRTVMVWSVNMATDGSMRPSCAIQRTFSRYQPNPGRSSCTVVCRESLFLVALQRYGKDLGFQVIFPQAIHPSDSLYDATVTDGDCKLRVTVDPSLNGLVERNILRCGCRLRNVSFAPGLSVREEARDRSSCKTYRVVSLEVVGDSETCDGREPLTGVNVGRLPWFGVSTGGDPDRDTGQEAVGPFLLPLRAQRNTYLPLWNNTDYYGAAWRDTPPSHNLTDTEEEEGEEVSPAVTIRELQEEFSRWGGTGGGARQRGGARRRLVVRVMNKSKLVYYGKADTNCECPYKALLEVRDVSAGVCVVLWNSVCVEWYRSLRQGQLLSLVGYRVKRSFRTQDQDPAEIELSLNSRNPAADITILPESSVSLSPPNPSYSFHCGKELLDCPHGNLCDVIGLVVFAGRPERIRSKDAEGAGLLEYCWLLLEDGTTDQPIAVQLFSTSQPETHSKIHPLSVVVATRMKLIRSPESSHQHLTSTSYTQVYCSGSGHHSKMPYRRLRPVRQFVQWLQSLDDGQVLDRAVVGGFFSYPPLPVTLENFMRRQKGVPQLLRGEEFQREVKRLQYREKRTLCIQATITMVSHCRRGEEDQCLLWTDRRSAPSSPRLPPSSPRLPPFSPCHSPFKRSSFSPSTSLNTSLRLSPITSNITPSSPLRLSPISYHLSPTIHPPSSPCSSACLSPSSSGSPVKLNPRLQTLPAGSKRRLFRPAEAASRKRRLALNTPHTQEDDDSHTGTLWSASMEFLQNNDEEDDDDDDDDDQSFLTAPSHNSSHMGMARVAMETLPLRFCYERREEQSVALAMQAGDIRKCPIRGALETFSPAHSYTGHYTLTLRALTDGVVVDAVFLPAPPHPPLCPPQTHANLWSSILQHGAFSSHTPPPAAADLIAMAAQLSNQRLLCVLEVCSLGGDVTELVLSRAYPLRD
ncbi:RPA-related protein RADX isoform X1 [Hypomesus transpacificus]|uniref:RPA-related protein RADX isoform X1 n=2 Tax=Hypomesus transpacificus TaxID=137520 RepID=UPI001F08320A|nr:RPA-related protein RADX isoform X1 [Hypomesus transpacificus]